MCSEKSQEQRDWCERQKMARWCVTASFFVFGFVLYRHCRLRCSCFIMIDAWVCVWVVVECMLAGLLPVALLFKWHTFHWSRSVSCWRCGKSLLCLLGCCSFSISLSGWENAHFLHLINALSLHSLQQFIAEPQRKIEQSSFARLDNRQKSFASQPCHSFNHFRSSSSWYLA